ncbi:MAG: YfhO family protein [Candidatus Latescibacteria bacterium]|nr:YfhO family protein [Candidatus Latescibacterota bacterium]
MTEGRSVLRESALVCVLLAGGVYLIVGRLFVKGWTLVEGDTWMLYYPAKAYCFSLLKQGEFPLWTPNLFFGFPLFAEAQAGVLYPLSVVFLFLPTWVALNVSIAIRLVLAGLFMFLYVRTLDRNGWAAALSAVTFACGGYLIAQLRHENVENALIWLPLILLAVRRWVTTGNRRALALAGTGIGVSFLAGYFFISLLVLLTASAYAILFICFARKDGTMRDGRPLHWAGGLAAIGLMGIGLAGIQILPNYELAQHSIRAGGLAYDVSTQVSVSPFHLICFFFPKFFGYPPDGSVWGLWRSNPIDLVAYLGILPLLLAVGAILIRRDWHTRFFAVVAGTALLLALGQFSPLWRLLHVLPVFSMMRTPARFLSLVAFSGAVLAGLGLDAVMRPSGAAQPRLRRYGRLVVRGAGLIVIASLASEWVVAAARPAIITTGRWFIDRFVYGQSVHRGSLEHYYTLLDQSYAQLAQVARITHPYIYIPVLYVIGSALFIWWVTRQSRGQAAAGLVSLLIAGSDLVLFGRLYNSLIPQNFYEQKQYYVEVMEKDTGLFRYCFAPLNDSMRNYDALLFHQQDIQGYSPLQMERHEELIETLRPQAASLASASAIPLLNLLNIKYIITGDSLTQDWAVVRFNEGMRVYENRAVLPRAFVVPTARFVPTRDRALAAVADTSFNPHETVIIEGERPEHLDPQGERMAKAAPTDSSGQTHTPRADIIRYGNHEVVIEVISGGGYLVLTDTYYPGWRAEVDGIERSILLADYHFRAVNLDPGRHRVRFWYDPLSFKVGAGLSLLSLGAILGLMLAPRRTPP